MSVDWAERQRNTNRLARKLAAHLFENENITALQLYGLSRLAWITDSYEGDEATYISSTKIPALTDILGKNYDGKSLNEVAKDIAALTGDESLKSLVAGHSGFTNFYNAFRNSVLSWIKKHLKILTPLYRDAYAASTDSERLDIIKRISKLPKIPKANNIENGMRPEYFLTPALFILDRDIRFPLINGNKWVKRLQGELDVVDSDLVTQYKKMTSLYGTNGVVDAADLDQVGRYFIDFGIKTRLLEEKDTSDHPNLPLKDENDVEVILSAKTITQRRLHNQLTNKLRAYLSRFTLLEGKSDDCMFDVLVKSYDVLKRDLLIEVKSSTETPHIRMAVGQLYSYWHALSKESPYNCLAVLLPTRPERKIEEFLGWMEIGLLWFEKDKICTVDDWLKSVATVVERQTD